MTHANAAVKSFTSSEQNNATTTSEITISVEQQDIRFNTNHKTLLESIESANIEIHYHCRDGYCGACRVTLESGEISYPNGEPLAYVGENEILPCCCIPQSNIKITID